MVRVMVLPLRSIFRVKGSPWRKLRMPGPHWIPPPD